MRFVVLGDGSFGVIAVGQHAYGFFALGQEATGVIAVGQLATGVVAVGQLARGGIVLGQLSLGLVCAGQLAVGVIWTAGLGIGATAGPGAVFGLFGRMSRRRLLAIVRRTPQDKLPRRPWRLAAGLAGTAALAAGWWFGAGYALVALRG